VALPAMFPNKPKIRTKTVTVKKVPAPAPRTPSAAHTRPAGLNGRSLSGPPANRYQVTPAQTKSRDAARQSLSVSRVQKRKVSPSTPQWASSDDDSDEDEDRLGKRRKTRPASNSTEPMNLNRTLEPDLRRRIRIREPETNGATSGKTNGASNGASSTNTDGATSGASHTKTSEVPNGKNGALNGKTSRVENGKNGASSTRTNGAQNGKTNGRSEGRPVVGVPAEKKPSGRRGSLIQGWTMSRGEEAKNYRPAFPSSIKNPLLQLQYPSTCPPERFEGVNPLDAQEGYSPLEDIYFSIEEIIQHYLPPDLANELSNDTEGIVRLLKRAVSKDSPLDFQSELAKFNTLIRDKLADGTIPRIMDAMHALPLSLVKRITAQTYNRIVSPQAHRLRKVKGKETTYGELLTPFVHKIFAQTGLNSSHVFVDLGSGVGNVVLQAALQTGAESWGIEKMSFAADLGRDQARELQARARLWNISLGAIRLLKGDFLETPEIDDVLRRADVVLVNNKVFGEKLNNDLLQKFLDLKDGCKVVSLESFGGGAKQGVRHEQAIAGLFDEERFDSGTFSVSWAGESVEYFIATKAR
jgi:H3 lysine-79-specific histone-lysine N-methyltransferase